MSAQPFTLLCIQSWIKKTMAKVERNCVEILPWVIFVAPSGLQNSEMEIEAQRKRTYWNRQIVEEVFGKLECFPRNQNSKTSCSLIVGSIPIFCNLILLRSFLSHISLKRYICLYSWKNRQKDRNWTELPFFSE